MSPLRQRMIEDMAIRQFGPKTQHDYVRVVADFARFLGRSPDRAEPEDLRRYQLHLAGQGASPGKMNLAVSALRFFCKVTLGRPSASGWRRCARASGCQSCSAPRRWRCCCTAPPA
jgi:hypothetical protein